MQCCAEDGMRFGGILNAFSSMVKLRHWPKITPRGIVNPDGPINLVRGRRTVAGLIAWPTTVRE